MILNMVNKVAGPAAAIIGVLNKIDGAALRASQKLAAMGDKLQKQGTKLREMSNMPMLAMVGAGFGIMKTAATYEKSMQKIASITGQTTQEAIDTYGKRAIYHAKNTGQTIEDIAAAQYDAISRNVPQDQVDSFIQSSLKTAKVGTTVVSVTSKALAMLRNVWSEIPTEQMGGLLAQAQQFGGTEIEPIANQFGRVAAQLKNAGVTAAEGLSLVASLTQTGNIEESITGIGAMMRTIVKPTDEYKKEMKTLGIVMNKSTVEQYGLAKSMEILQLAINKTYKTEAERTEAMGRAFNENMAFNAMINFLSKEGQGVYNKSLKSMTTSTDYLTKRSKTMGTTIFEESAKARESFKGLAIELAGPFMEALNGAMKGLVEFIADISNAVKASDDLQFALKAIAGIIATIIATVWAAGWLLTFIGKVTVFMSGLLSFLTSIGGALAGLGASFAAFMAIPSIGLFLGIFAAVTAVIIGVILLIKHWKAVSNALARGSKAAREAIISAFNAVGRAADAVLYPIFNLFVKIGSAIASAKKAAAQFAVDLASGIGSGIMAMLRAVGDWFVSLGTWFYNAGRDAGNAFIRGLKSIPGAAWDKIKEWTGFGDDGPGSEKVNKLFSEGYKIPDASRPVSTVINNDMSGMQITAKDGRDAGNQIWGVLKEGFDKQVKTYQTNQQRVSMADAK